MGENTKIEWCTHTWNPWFGCTEVGPACDFCYARVMMSERYGRVGWGAGEDRKRTAPSNWKQPLKWDRIARADGMIATVFCLSLGDIWDNEVDPRWRHDAFDVMERTPNLLYLLLSKRVGNAIKMCDPLAGNRCLPPNAALGATMINQEEWDRDLPKLQEAARALGARFTFASVEPMLGPIKADHRGLPDWVIVGGESGPNARPMHPDWARSLRDQCVAAGVTFFFKQWGEYLPVGQSLPGFGKIHGATAAGGRLKLHGTDAPKQEPKYVFAERVVEFASIDNRLTLRVGKKAAGRLLDGVEHNGFPAR